MNWFQALILGLVQGATELLPISSSAHLIIIPNILGWGENTLVFDTTLHLGTASALIIYFRKLIFRILVSLKSDYLTYGKKIYNYSSDSLLCFKIIAGTVPAGIVGFLFNDLFEEKFRDIKYTVYFLILGTILMFISQAVNDRKRKKDKDSSLNILTDEDNITYSRSIFIGMFQILALFPGFSRSGSTISAGMLSGLKKYEAAKYSFLLSIPIVLAAGVFQGLSSGEELFLLPIYIPIIGYISSLLSGLLAIKFLLNFLNNHSLNLFIFYRLVLAASLLLFIPML
ncbi:MAG TPA: undecaprenyl-diphosphatase UppP [bacterium]|nr:undecaprenyl-diphosphatase UppP [bacterium]